MKTRIELIKELVHIINELTYKDERLNKEGYFVGIIGDTNVSYLIGDTLKEAEQLLKDL